MTTVFVEQPLALLKTFHRWGGFLHFSLRWKNKKIGLGDQWSYKSCVVKLNESKIVHHLGK